jgi:serine protease inhibitor
MLYLTTIPFDVTAQHDLLETPDVFGLRTVSQDDREEGHFPGIADDPLVVGAAGQNVLARFSETGFEAAAATEIGLADASGTPPEPTIEVKLIAVDVLQPFAYYTVHRPTGLIFVAGWITEPEYLDASKFPWWA